jgi:hypothetical protein
VTRLPGGVRCATHMTASASCERDSGRGTHGVSHHAARDPLRRPRRDRAAGGDDAFGVGKSGEQVLGWPRTRRTQVELPPVMRVY